MRGIQAKTQPGTVAQMHRGAMTTDDDGVAPAFSDLPAFLGVGELRLLFPSIKKDETFRRMLREMGCREVGGRLFASRAAFHDWFAAGPVADAPPVSRTSDPATSRARVGRRRLRQSRERHPKHRESLAPGFQFE